MDVNALTVQRLRDGRATPNFRARARARKGLATCRAVGLAERKRGNAPWLTAFGELASDLLAQR